MSRITKKAQEIPPFIVMDVLERAHELEKQGREIIHLEIGEPDFPTPECICQAAVSAMNRGETHYTHSLGIPQLREAICEHYLNTYGVEVTPDRVMVTSGTSPALFMIFSAVLDPGDQIILSDPHYPCYPNFAGFIGAEPVFVKGYESEGFQVRPEDVKKAMGARTRAALINSPSNPTGNVLSQERMAQIADLGIPVISDEIYHGLVYGEDAHSILEFTDNAFVLNGFSKLYAMTGWRLGYLICPSDFIRPLQKIQQNFFISAGSLSQWAGLAALTQAGSDVARMKSIYNERRLYMIARLRELEFGLPVDPMGAFYVLADAGKFSGDSFAFAFELLENTGVGTSPGVDFGKNAEGHIRFSYANSLENIKEGLDRIGNYLKAR